MAKPRRNVQLIGLWFDKPAIQALEELTQASGLNKSAVVRQLLRHARVEHQPILVMDPCGCGPQPAVKS